MTSDPDEAGATEDGANRAAAEPLNDTIAPPEETKKGKRPILELDPDTEVPEVPGVTVTGMLGRGGQGVVFLGFQDFLNRDVAVKILHRSVDRDLARFRQEATILARLQHPNIVACHQAGVTDEHQCYMVLEFVDGSDLYEHVRLNGPLSEHSALALIADLALGLKHGYEDKARVIHRDIKPQNVLLQHIESERGPGLRAKIVDLGLARCLEESMEITQPGALMGTPSSMAPEQFDHPDQVDHRTDIYGLGCVLFYAMTGDPAFKGRTFSSIWREKTSPKGAKPHRHLEISDGTRKLFDAMLAQEQRDRPATYDELLDQIKLVRRDLSKQKVLAGKNRRTAWVLGAVSVAAVATAIFFATRQGPEPKPNDPGPVAVTPVPPENEDAPAAPEAADPVEEQAAPPPGIAPLRAMNVGSVLPLFPEESPFDGWRLASHPMDVRGVAPFWTIPKPLGDAQQRSEPAYPRGRQIASFEEESPLVVSLESVRDKRDPAPYLVAGASAITHAVPEGDWRLKGRLALMQEGGEDFLLSGLGLRRVDGSVLELAVIVIFKGDTKLGDKAIRRATVRAAWMTASGEPLLDQNSVAYLESKTSTTGEDPNAARALSGFFLKAGAEVLSRDVVVVDVELLVFHDSFEMILGDQLSLRLGTPDDFSDQGFNRLDIFCRSGFVSPREWRFLGPTSDSESSSHR